MRIPTILALTALFALGGCTKDENSPLGPPNGQEDLVGQEFSFKVKSEEWEAFGTPGDDTHGYAAIGEVYILTDENTQNGTVRVYVKRGTNNWAELPMLADQGAPLGVNWRFTCRAGSVQVIIDRNGAAFDPPNELMVFKAVVFPG